MVSGALVERLGLGLDDVRSLGRHRLRGKAHEVELFALATDPAAEPVGAASA